MREPTALLLGNSDGIGLALTRRLVRDGWRVWSMSRSACPAEGLVEHVVCDAASPEFEALLRELVERIGDIDVCVHLIATAIDFDPESLRGEVDQQRVNFLSIVQLMEVVVPRMVRRASGHVVGVSSLADELLVATCPGYPASKAAMSSYLCGAAKPLRRRGVAVTNIRFGFVDTKMAQAPVKPRMVTPDRAVDVILRALRRRPVQVSFPLSTALIVRLLRWLQRPLVWWGRGPR